MSETRTPYVCPAELAGTLDNALRRLVHKPEKILGPFISEGMTVLDLGCGPGYFTAGMANLVGSSGKVIAADIQPEMLEKMMKKIIEAGFESRVSAHLCQSNSIGITRKVDLVLAFWMVHEVIDQDGLFRELKSLLNPGGRIWIIEPKIHVTGEAFKKMTGRLESAGFQLTGRPKVAISRSVTAIIRSE